MRLIVAAIGLSLFLGKTAAAKEVELIRGPQIRVEAEDAHIQIRAEGVRLRGTRVSSRGDRLIVPIEEIEDDRTIRVSNDETIKRIKLADGRHSRLMVQLRHGRDKTDRIASAAQLQQSDSTLIVTVPRWPIQKADAIRTEQGDEADSGVKGAVRNAAEATRSGEDAAFETSATAGSEGQARASKDPTAAAGSASKGEIDEKIAAAHDSAEAAGTAVEEPQLGKQEEQGQGYVIVLGVLALAGGAAMLFRKKRKRGDDVPAAELQVVATKHLGGKARIVWLNAGERELLVAVGDGSPRLLSQWRQRPGSATSKASVFEQKLKEMAPEPEAQASPTPKRRTLKTRKPTSPAIAGILKLRGEEPAVSEDVATEDADADAEWARELLKATRGSILRRLD